MKIRSILALSDFSPGAENALERAAAIASAHQAELRIMYVDETAGDHLADRLERLDLRARQLARSHRVRAIALPRVAGSLHDVLVETRRTDLVVLDTLSRRRFRGSLGGRAFEQVARHGHCPALLARIPATQAYGKAVVAFGSAAGIGKLIEFVRRLEGAPQRLTVQVFVARLTAGEKISAPAFGNALQRAWLTLRAWLGALGNAGACDSIARQIIAQRAQLGADLVIVPRIKPAIMAGLPLADAVRALIRQLDCDLILVPAADCGQPDPLASSLCFPST